MTTLIEILATEYGVGPVEAPDYAVLWAASELPPDEGRAGIRKINALKAKWGRPLVYVPYGHKCF